jgi:hypothetical protein
MKLNMSLVAIILGSIAIIISLSQPAYNFLMASINPRRTPSFEMEGYGIETYNYFTRISFRNSGTATAHDVIVELDYLIKGFVTPPFMATAFAMSQLAVNKSLEIKIPIGTSQLLSAPSIVKGWVNVTDIQAYIVIRCFENSPGSYMQVYNQTAPIRWDGSWYPEWVSVM